MHNQPSSHTVKYITSPETHFLFFLNKLQLNIFICENSKLKKNMKQMTTCDPWPVLPEYDSSNIMPSTFVACGRLVDSLLACLLDGYVYVCLLMHVLFDVLPLVGFDIEFGKWLTARIW